MQIKDLKEHIFEKIQIYNTGTDTYKTIYSGDIQNTPDNLIKCEVAVIGAKRKGVVDIGIKGGISRQRQPQH